MTNDYGNLLREFRLKTCNLKTKKPITQQEFGELLFEEMGIGYSGAAVSDWERGASKIHADDRLILVSIIKILKKHGGVKNLTEANQLLETGNYRTLNSTERTETFQEYYKTPSSLLEFVFPYLFFGSAQEFNSEWEKAKEGPTPVWPRFLVALIRKLTDKISPIHAGKFILWIWIFMVGYWLIIPSFQFPFADNQEAFNSILLYTIGTFIFPFGIGLMVNTKNNPFWREQNLPKPLVLSLYVFQGAYIGFHVAYFFSFLIAFLAIYFQAKFSVLVEILILLFIITFSYAGAHLVPHNLLRAYQRLDIRDGWIFFIFIIVGPAWAWFFLKFYNMLLDQVQGVLLMLTALTLVIVIEIHKNNKN